MHCAHLLGRAEQMLDYDRRTGNIAMERDALQARVSDLEAERINREPEIKEIDQARTTLLERGSSLARAFTAKEAALARAEDTIAALTERLGVLETALATDKQATEQEIEDLNATVRREKLERAVVEGALETGRKDFARLMRDVMALHNAASRRRKTPCASAPPTPLKPPFFKAFAASPGYKPNDVVFGAAARPNQSGGLLIYRKMDLRRSGVACRYVIPAGAESLYTCHTASMPTCRRPCATTCPSMRRTSIAKRSTTPPRRTPVSWTRKSAPI